MARLPLPLGLACLLALATGCGSSKTNLVRTESGSGPSNASTINLAADPSGAFKFDRDQIEIPSAGPVRLVMTMKGTLVVGGSQ